MAIISFWVKSVTTAAVLTALLGARAAAAAEYVDADAGVRFPIPFPDPQRKTAAQVKALVLDHPEVELPEGARFTGGLYAKSGLPFIIVWARRDRAAPVRSLLRKMEGLGPAALKALYGLEALTFDQARLRGVGEVALAGGLRGRVLIQIARGETIGIGYYDVEGAVAAPFEQLVAGFELAPGKRLAWDDLPRGAWYWARIGAAGIAFTAVAAATAWWFSRRARQER